MDCKNLIVGVILILINQLATAQPGLQGDLYLNLNIDKYFVEAYSIIENDQHGKSGITKLNVEINPQNNGFAIIKFANLTYIKKGFTNNVILILSNKKSNKKIIIFITGHLNPFRNYTLTPKLSPRTFSIYINENEELNLDKKGSRLDLTPKLERENNSSHPATTSKFLDHSGNYLSNEIFYRVAKMREEWINQNFHQWRQNQRDIFA